MQGSQTFTSHSFHWNVLSDTSRDMHSQHSRNPVTDVKHLRRSRCDYPIATARTSTDCMPKQLDIIHSQIQ